MHLNVLLFLEVHKMDVGDKNRKKNLKAQYLGKYFSASVSAHISNGKEESFLERERERERQM